jgi:hypothetical protein
MIYIVLLPKRIMYTKCLSRVLSMDLKKQEHKNIQVQMPTHLMLEKRQRPTPE